MVGSYTTVLWLGYFNLLEAVPKRFYHIFLSGYTRGNIDLYTYYYILLPWLCVQIVSKEWEFLEGLHFV